MKKKCLHDHKNAVQVGSVDHMCPLCKELIDPGEWFFINNFNFVDVTPEKVKKQLIKRGFKGVVLESKSGKKVSAKKNYLPNVSNRHKLGS